MFFYLMNYHDGSDADHVEELLSHIVGQVHTAVGAVGLINLSAEAASPVGVVKTAASSGKGHPVVDPVVPGGTCEVGALDVSEYGIDSCGSGTVLADITGYAGA